MKDRIYKIKLWFSDLFTWIALYMGAMKVKPSAPRMTSNPLLEWPRNFRCICGSGKKFKRCCLPELSPIVTFDDAISLNERLNKYRK